MSRANLHHNAQGQTVVALLIFVVLAISLTTMAVTLTAVHTRANNSVAAGEQARANAEAGADNAMRRLLMDPNYAGETMTLANGTATINVSGTTTKTIVSQGVYNSARRTITVTASYTNNILTLTTWSETP